MKKQTKINLGIIISDIILAFIKIIPFWLLCLIILISLFYIGIKNKILPLIIFLIHVIIFFIGICYLGAVYTSNSVEFIIFMGLNILFEIIFWAYILMRDLPQPPKEKKKSNE